MNGKNNQVVIIMVVFCCSKKEVFYFTTKITNLGEFIMKEFNYKEVGKEIGWSFAKINPIVENPSGFNYYKEVTNLIGNETVMLDIGCGSAEKAVRYFSFAKEIFETDNEIEMLKKAQVNAEKYYETNPNTKSKFKFQIMDCNGKFPFDDGMFDVVVSRHCGANMNEVFRVLKQGGAFVSEDYWCGDCIELKQMFERGQDYGKQPLYTSVFAECEKAGFSEIKLVRFEQIEFYKSLEELKYLLLHTPILNGYDEKADDEILEKYAEKYKTKKGIKLSRKLYAFILKK